MKILAFGEVMMRLMVPDNKMLSQSEDLKYLFCGTGVNVLSGLKNMGHKVYLSTKLPENNIGSAAVAHIRKLGIDDSLISHGGNHMGMYFLEVGFGQRPAEVTYMNRNMSSFGLSTIDDYNLDELLNEIDAIHICGISLALNENTRNVAMELAMKAKEKGIKVIFDCNFRPTLWSDEDRPKAKGEYVKMLNLADIVFAGEKDATLLLNIEDNFINEGENRTFKLLDKMRDIYGIDVIFGTDRSISSSNKQMIQGFRVDSEGFICSENYELTVLDRIGGGDGFAAGAIHAFITNMDREEGINFATCSGVLAHTTYGDSPIATLKQINRMITKESVDIIR